MLKSILEWLTPETIQAIGIVVTGVLTIWVGRQSIELKKVRAELDEIKGERAKDRGVIKAAARFIRAQSVHIAILCGLLRQHAPHVEIPPEPVLPEELEEV